MNAISLDSLAALNLDRLYMKATASRRAGGRRRPRLVARGAGCGRHGGTAVDAGA